MRTPLVAVLLSSLFAVSIVAADEPESSTEPQWAPTGRLSQFRGFNTPRPQLLPENAQLMYASIWAAWSAWSFCSNGVQIRVRACNTVKGFSCLGPNQETKPCDDSQPVHHLHHQQLSDYDVIDPWQADREEALKQLYPDDMEKKQSDNEIPNPGSFRVLSGGKTHQPEPPTLLRSVTPGLGLEDNGAPGTTPEKLFGVKQFAAKNDSHKEVKHKGSGIIGSSEKALGSAEDITNAKLLDMLPMEEKSSETKELIDEDEKSTILKTTSSPSLTTTASTTTTSTTPSTTTTTSTVATPTTTTVANATSSSTTTTTQSTTTIVTKSHKHISKEKNLIKKKAVKLTSTDLENQRKAIGDRISQLFSGLEQRLFAAEREKATEDSEKAVIEEEKIPLFEADLRNAAKLKTFHIDEEATISQLAHKQKKKGFGFTGVTVTKTTTTTNTNTDNPPVTIVDNTLHTGEVTTTGSAMLVEVVPEDQISPDTLSVLDWMLKNMTKAASEAPQQEPEPVSQPTVIVHMPTQNGAFISDDGSVKSISPILNEQTTNSDAELIEPAKPAHKRKIKKLRKSHKNKEKAPKLHLGDYNPANPDPSKMFPKFKAKAVEQARARALGVRTFHSDKDNLKTPEHFPSDQESEALMNEIDQLQKLMKDMDERIDVLNNQQAKVMNSNEADLDLPLSGSETNSDFISQFSSEERDNEGRWSSWTDWGVCFCEKQVRTRVCSYTTGSVGCKGSSHESRDCTGGICPKSASSFEAIGDADIEPTPVRVFSSLRRSLKPVRLQQAAHLLP